ncbi:translation initiation factor IF-2-like [Cricetulus griseus]|uniref:Translation initiation factor IF-2-like n=1 Tax=Cricetulus griseus TaxID=10029 RepID=A0A9J7GRH4_CRIGR|nr:translation initiation factor IF-2-like [Cricetulus griseus]
MVLSGGQSPGARRSRRPRPAGPPSSRPRPGLPAPAPRALGPPPAFARSPGTGVIRRLCCHGRCRNRLPAPAAPAPPCAFPEPGPGAARGPRDAVAVRAYLSPVRPRRGVRGRQSRAAWPNCPRRCRLCPALLLLLLLLLLPPRSVSPARRRAAAAGLFLSGYVKVT